MKVYIAASWKHQHAVELLTDLLEQTGHEVVSFVREAVTSGEFRVGGGTLETWIESADGERKFVFDLQGATGADVVIYIGSSDTDAWAEVGAAWACGVPVLGLWAKGEPAGLMRRMVSWFNDYRLLVAALNNGADVQRLARRPAAREVMEKAGCALPPEPLQEDWTEGQRQAVHMVLEDRQRTPGGGGRVAVGRCPSCVAGQIFYRRTGGVIGQIEIWCTACSLNVRI